MSGGRGPAGAQVRHPMEASGQPGARYGHLQRRAREPSVLPVRRGAREVGDHRRLRRRQLLPGRAGHARADGDVPGEGAGAAVAVRDLARVVALAALLTIAGRGLAGAQEASFGPGEQMVHLGSVSFRPTVSSLGFFEDTAGYLYGAAGAVMTWVAPVTLPEGAELTEMCLYAWDADVSRTINLHLDALR